MFSRGRLAVLFFFFSLAGAQGDPINELASFSVFANADLNQLAKSEARPVRGPAMATPRFQSVQSCWVQSGTPAQVMSSLRTFNPVKYSELRVFLHNDGLNFSALKSPPENPALQWLTAATESKPPELQISRAEAAKKTPFAEFWAGLLKGRAGAGVFRQPPYDHTGKNIRPGDEVNALLNEQPNIKKQFRGLISAKGAPSWELIDLN